MNALNNELNGPINPGDSIEIVNAPKYVENNKRTGSDYLESGKRVEAAILKFLRLPADKREALFAGLSRFRNSIDRFVRAEQNSSLSDSKEPARKEIQDFFDVFAVAQMEHLQLEWNEAKQNDGIVYDLEMDFSMPMPSYDTLVRKSIGEGSHSVVYAAQAIGGIDGLQKHSQSYSQLEPIAIKVAKASRHSRDTSSDLLKAQEYLKAEASLLDSLSNKQKEIYPDSDSHFPDAVLLPEKDGEIAMAMEMLKQEDLLHDQCSKKTIRPEQVWSCVIQHFEALDVVHRGLQLSVNDKKDRDYTYIQSADRLVITDWGVTQPVDEVDNFSGLPRYKIDLKNALNFYLHFGSEILPHELTNKLEALKSRIEQKEDTTKAKDILEILREVDIRDTLDK